jgi:type III pantothenate kinase
MFLAIDIGNTRLKWALFERVQPGAAPVEQGAVFLERIEELAEGPWKTLDAPTGMLGCNVAGEAVRRRVEEQLELWDLPTRWVVPSQQAGGVVNGYDIPTRLGADRFVAQIGARWHVLHRGPSRPSRWMRWTLAGASWAGSSCPATGSCCARWKAAPPGFVCPPARWWTSPPTPATP